MSDTPSHPSRHRTIYALLAAIFFFGVAVIAILPPYEGLDETAHFSRFQAIAYTPQIILMDNSLNQYLSTETYKYYRKGPMPYYWVYANFFHLDDPQYNLLNDNPEKDFADFHGFFENPALVEDYTKSYWQSPLPPGFAPGPEFNWQYQHPFLYYAIFAPGLKMLAGHASLLTTLLVLRFFSWLLAFSGLCIAFYGTWSYLTATRAADADKTVTLGALYPFFMPMFFWEFGRVGNDSLCLFFFGISWAMLLWHLREPKSNAWLYLGLFLGVGWLAKALLIPSSLGIVAFLAFRALITPSKKNARRDNWLSVIKIAGLMALVGAPLYVASYIYYGSTGSLEMGYTKSSDWLLFFQHIDLFIGRIGSALVGILSMVVWMFGTMSLVVIDLPLDRHAYIYSFTIIVFLSYAWALCRRPSLLLQLPIWIILPMIGGLVAHIIAILILGTTVLTPGYYLHILAPVLALIFGVGLTQLTKNKWLAIAIGIPATALVAFNFYIAWAYMTVFAGCSQPVHNESFFVLDPAEVYQCTGQFDKVIGNLGIVAFPDLALCCFGSAFILLIAAAIFAVSATRRTKTGEAANAP